MYKKNSEEIDYTENQDLFIDINDIIDIAKNSGKILLKYYGKNIETKNKGSSGYNPVSIADIESNKNICEHLKKYGYQILSEESENKDLDLSKPTWIVDPLDGTIGFLKKSEEFCIMIGLLVNGKIVLGVVYAPIYDKVYYAENGKGAWLIDKGVRKKITVSNVKELKNACRSVRPFAKPNFLDVIMDSKLKCRKKILGSLGLRICSVAEGKTDFYINNSSTPSKWDTAAPTIILEEAGGKITDFKNNPLNYLKSGLQWNESFIVSNGFLHEQILKEIPKDALNLMNLR